MFYFSKLNCSIKLCDKNLYHQIKYILKKTRKFLLCDLAFHCWKSKTTIIKVTSLQSILPLWLATHHNMEDKLFGAISFSLTWMEKEHENHLPGQHYFIGFWGTNQAWHDLHWNFRFIHRGLFWSLYLLEAPLPSGNSWAMWSTQARIYRSNISRKIMLYTLPLRIDDGWLLGWYEFIIVRARRHCVAYSSIFRVCES